ncbi:MAG: zinc ribbon domain-containing protein [Candidatus Thermoplasmatota archaeon]|nr:zinc ribbon domain-containing protein [Candidatus Thermoplasmatota archaeon]
MKKIFIPPIVVLIVMSVVALWSAFRLQAIPESAEIPSAALRFTALIVGAVIAACIILVTIAGDLKLEKIPAEKIVAEEERVAEEVPAEEEVAVKPPEAPPKPVGEAEEMVVCGGCGALVPASSKTCPNCGAEFEE